MRGKLTKDEREALDCLIEQGGSLANISFLLTVGDDVARSLTKSGLIRKARGEYRITDLGRTAVAGQERSP